jgi:hypothetical protein
MKRLASLAAPAQENAQLSVFQKFKYIKVAK